MQNIKITPDSILEHFKNISKVDEVNSNKELLTTLEALKIDPKEDIKPPQIAWRMKNKNNDGFSILGTLGNIGLIIGKAKSRKSFYVSIAVSCAVSNDTILEQYEGCLPNDKRNVLYFDTEQGKYHVQLALKRICKQINIDEPENLFVYGLRSKTPAERLKLIEYAIYNTPNLGFVIIDGIKDLITSINDEEQATMISSKLLKWTEEKEIHIITILHQNKSDSNARGHIGTELINKAETVLSVTKSESDPDISIVEPQQCRNKEPEIFAFEIIDGLPCRAENYELRTETNKNRIDVTDIDENVLYELLESVFKNNTSFGYTELTSQMKIAYKNMFNKSIGTNRAKDLITICKNSNWLIQDKPKAPYTLGENQNPF